MSDKLNKDANFDEIFIIRAWYTDIWKNLPVESTSILMPIEEIDGVEIREIIEGPQGDYRLKIEYECDNGDTLHDLFDLLKQTSDFIEVIGKDDEWYEAKFLKIAV